MHTVFNYRDYLNAELQTRIAKNPRYSMRALARDLALSPQMISSVLGGKKDLSVDSAAEIASKLGFDPSKTQDFLDAVVLEGCKSDLAKAMIRQRIEGRNQVRGGFRPLSLEMFKAISDWYHLAILELLDCRGFKSDVRWVATRLGISVHEVKEALARLKTLELLEERDGKLLRTEFRVSALSDVPAAALREHARQIFAKGTAALQEQQQDERDVTSMTMAIDPRLLPEAKKMILQFRRKLCRFLESGDRTEVYVFLPALFRLTQKERKKTV